ncbi:MAG: helix-turn-helix domain-containing protein [Deltaproteobacteria bacterium]|jgi:hypothetical protein|nr:helix-turn-helix domain-containing protein [Deltaproteobacteria bacterium]
MAFEKAHKPLFVIGMKEIARMLGCGVREVKALIRDEEFPVCRVGRAYMTTPGRALEWIEARIPRPGGGPGTGLDG